MRSCLASSRLTRILAALAVTIVVVASAGSRASHAVEMPVEIRPPNPHLNACFPEPALPTKPYLGAAVTGALTYDDWLATVIAEIQGCDSLRMPEFGELLAPLADPVVSSMFGPRLHPVRQRWLPHTGVDLVDRERRWRVPVHAAGAGTVAATGSFEAYGLSLIVDHGHRVATVYTHLSSIAVSEGDSIEAGARIGRVGASGGATGPHLHLELRLGAAAVDPLDYIAPWHEPPDGHP